MSTRTPSPDQELAIRKIEDGTSKYSLLTAGPGYGKSYVVQELHDRGHPIIKASTTGVSAINIGGVTINSLLGYFDSVDMCTKHEAGRIYESLQKYAGRVVVVDEVSMLSSTQFQIMVLNNERLEASTGNSVRFLFVGDFGQLPPVKETPAFESTLWKYVDVLTLSQVHRTSDLEFIDALRSLRVGDAKSAFPYFEGLGFHRSIDMDFEGTTLYAINASADRHNKYSLERLPGESKYYYPIKKGDPVPEWKNIQDPLELKVGALVIMRSNQWESGYANGDQGYVTSMGVDYVDVDLLRGGSVRVELTEIKHKTASKKGAITFLPVMLAYALTTHKAQSLSINHLQVVMDDPDNSKNLWFMGKCHGMGFMALSRSTTPSNLRIVGGREAFHDGIYCDRKYLPYIN